MSSTNLALKKEMAGLDPALVRKLRSTLKGLPLSENGKRMALRIMCRDVTGKTKQTRGRGKNALRRRK